MEPSSLKIYGSRRRFSGVLTFAKIIVTILVLITIVLLSMILAFSPKSPPQVNSINKTATSVDFSDLPAYSYFTARDGTPLAYRTYPGSSDRIAILIHGSSGSSRNMHVLGKALSKNGITAFALDLRGHGNSGKHGDIAYVGQLEDDLTDFVAYIRSDYPDTPITLIGHSLGGGFALRIAGSSMSDRFDQYILLSPFLNYNSPTNRPNNGGWADVSVPRFAGITILNKFGIHYFDSWPVIAFAVPDNFSFLTREYSYKLLSNLSANRNYLNDDYLENFRKCSVPITILVGSNDELFYVKKYASEIKPVNGKVVVEIVPSVNHMAIVSDAKAVETIVHKFE
ncbi:MAG: alpha/beta hydrolase [Deltaproteobacteria bacterium]